MNIKPTPHIEINDSEDIAKTVIMPGDPLRAKMIATKYLVDVKEVNSVRNMLAYTGLYKNKKITVMGSGMGMPSIGIYSYELFNHYDVDHIIRVGSCGAYDPSLKLYDLIIVDECYSESTYAKLAANDDNNIQKADEKLTKALKTTAKEELSYHYSEGCIHSSDVFYRDNFNDFKTINQQFGARAVEMESFALFCNAKKANKKAACILTVSDSLINNELTTAKERQESFTKMIDVALNTSIKL